MKIILLLLIFSQKTNLKYLPMCTNICIRNVSYPWEILGTY